MNSDQLHTFLAVWRHQSFTLAANELGLAPSSVSRAVSALEEEIGARLFQRTTRAMTPTDAGQHLFEKADTLIDGWEDVRASIRGEDREPRGRLRVTASIAFAQMRIAPMLARFADTYPEIQIELSLSDQRVNLIENQIDVAIRHGELEDSALVARRLLRTKYRLVASPNLVARDNAIGTPSDLTSRPLVSFSFGDMRSAWTFSRGDESALVRVDPAITASNAMVVREAALAGAGYSLLADWMVADDLAKGRLVEALPDWQVSGPREASDVWIVYPSRRLIPQRTRAFADYLADEIDRS